MKWSGVGMSMALGCALACSSGDKAPEQTGAGGTGGSGSTAVSTTGSGGGTVATTTMGSTTGAAGGGAAGGGMGGSGGAALLPGGGREYKGVVNLVSASGPTDIERYLAQDDADLSALTREFYESYPDEYDFIIFVLPYGLPIETTATFASFDVINRPAIPGTGIDSAVHEPNFGTLGRLKGVFGTQGDPTAGRPPFAHELLHYWGNYLDNASFGFGVDLDYDYGAHWGHIGVFGQLGGFDPATLACAEPAGAAPPDCTPEDSGRIRYAMSAFGPNTNSFKGVDYASLELYLMGLIPVEEVPDPILVLDQPQYVALDPDADTAMVEADDILEVSTSDIVALHGSREPTPEAERHLSAAFVVVSDAPLDDVTLDAFVEWSDVLGNYKASLTGGTSFEGKTGGRMTLSTRIGRRRTADDPLPQEVAPDSCDVLAQDCGQPEVACIDLDDPECVSSGGLAVGSDCAYLTDCEPGAICSDNLMGGFTCFAYCDPTDAVVQRACSTLCPDAYVEVSGLDVDGNVVTLGALCSGP